MSSKPQKAKQLNEKGFSLLEAIVAILILTIGLMGAAGALTYSLQYSTTSKNVGNAKLIIVSTIEEIESLRNTRRLEFKQISNVSEVDNTDCKNTFNGFSTGFKPISLNPGFDGVSGTNDDIKEAGPDAIWGNADDVGVRANDAGAERKHEGRENETTSERHVDLPRVKVDRRVPHDLRTAPPIRAA